jgi:hypothetical protein
MLEAPDGMKRQIALAAFLGCFCFTAWAQTAAPEPYPDPQCIKPQATSLSATGINATDPVQVGRYNAKIRDFNRAAAAYSSCMRAYIDNANRDVTVIQEKANADLKQITERANASMKAIQDKVRQAAADANSVNAALDQDTAKLKK